MPATISPSAIQDQRHLALTLDTVHILKAPSETELTINITTTKPNHKPNREPFKLTLNYH